MDGIRLHLGHTYAFKHNDIADCEKQLERARKMIEKTGGGILVITEGVFGMDGEQGILREITALKKKFAFRMLIDDAHGFGYMGPTGAGADEAQGCQQDVDLYFSTFVKSMGSIGAFISGPKAVIKYLRYNTRSQIFAKSLPLIIVDGMLKRMDMAINMPELRAKLWHNVKRLQQGLKDRGFDIGNTNSPVTPIYMKGDVPEATTSSAPLWFTPSFPKAISSTASFQRRSTATKTSILRYAHSKKPRKNWMRDSIKPKKYPIWPIWEPEVDRSEEIQKL
jgi:glycine C-acetyltransferase